MKRELTEIIWKHHPVTLNRSQTEIINLLREHGPKRMKEVKELLPHITENSIKQELYNMVSDKMIHSGVGRNRYYAALEDKIPETAQVLKNGLGRKCLKIIEKGPIHENKICEFFPHVKPKIVKNSLYRLRGKVQGYTERVIRNADFIYKVKA